MDTLKNMTPLPGVERLTVNSNANATLATIAVDPNVDKIAAKAEDLMKVSKIAQGAAVLLILVVSTALLLPSPAMAQGKTKTAATTTHGMPCDPAHLLPGCQTTLDASGNPIERLLSEPMQQLADFIAGGFDDAVTLSTAVSNLQDGNGQACWSVLREYSAVLKAHPIPITLKFAADLESLRLLNMAAKKVCQTASCTQVFNELANGITSLSPISVPIPSISALCAKVPDIAVVAATPTPTPSPTP